MEWVETTAKSLDDAKSAALDRLGVAADEAEFDVLEEPKPGLFGRTRGEARVRARVKPTQVRPKNERRRRSSKSSSRGSNDNGAKQQTTEESSSNGSNDQAATSNGTGGRNRTSSPKQQKQTKQKQTKRSDEQENTMTDDNNTPESDVSPQEVGDAAVEFMNGLVSAFDAEGTTELKIDGTELDVTVSGEGLGLMVGPGGRTLNAIQDLARVSSQRRLGDHETRLRIDVAGYRERRSAALARFAADVAEQVRESGVARSLEPMSSADRKVIHDAVNDEDGVASRSEGDDPNRRVVVVPA